LASIFAQSKSWQAKTFNYQLVYCKKINNNGTPMFMAKILANFLETSYIAKERKGAF
jgi:hypothetical protein